MKQIHNIVNKARLRMQLNALLSRSSLCLVVLGGCLLLLSILDRVGTSNFIPWNIIWVGAGVLLAMNWISLWVRSTVTTIEAASEVDQRLQLRDRLSSAISCEHSDEPFSKAVIEDAIAIVESKNVHSSLVRFFPIVAPRHIHMVAVSAILIGVVLWTPQWGWWHDDQSNPSGNIIASNENIELSIEAILEQLENEELLSDSLEDELSALAATSANESLDTESLRREALRKITDVQKRLEELLQDENAMAFEEMLRRMQALKLPQNSNMQPMVADLKNGNFDQAKKEFERLQEQMESTELSEEERQQLAKALEELAKQLQKLSQANDALSSALSAAGLNGNFATNPDAAMKAIQNAKDLTEEQKKQLLELLKSQQQAAKMCKNMSKGCKQCAAGKNGAGMASELEKLKAMQMFKTKAQLAKLACQNAAQGMCNKPGSGFTGGEGLGDGGNNPLKETETGSVAERSPVQTLEGTIIARQLFEGGLLTAGDSTAEVRETVLAQQRDAEQAIIDEEVPRKYHDLLRHYFGQLEELTEPSNEDDTESSE